MLSHFEVIEDPYVPKTKINDDGTEEPCCFMIGQAVYIHPDNAPLLRQVLNATIPSTDGTARRPSAH